MATGLDVAIFLCYTEISWYITNLREGWKMKIEHILLTVWLTLVLVCCCITAIDDGPFIFHKDGIVRNEMSLEEGKIFQLMCW